MSLPPPSPHRTCVVTGASSGIGADIARQLAKRGLGVTLVARREGPLRDLANELSSAHRVRAEVVPVDLADGDARATLPSALAERGLEADVLVNNAGFSTTGPVYAGDRDREILLVRTDVEAVVDLCTMFLGGMVERGAGAVLNVASTAAFQPLPGQAAYGAAKSFVLSYTHALRGELRGTGVTATALCPGPVDTGFGEAAGFSKDEADNALPRFMWVKPESVAADAVAGMASGKGVVIPGVVNRVGAAAAHLAPRGVLVPLLARQHPALKRS